MKRLLAGIVIGVAVGGGGAFAAAHDLIARPGSRVIAQAGSTVSFKAIDLECQYGIGRGIADWLPAGPLSYMLAA